VQVEGAYIIASRGYNAVGLRTPRGDGMEKEMKPGRTTPSADRVPSFVSRLGYLL